MLTSGLFKSFMKHDFYWNYNYIIISIVLIAINQMWDECVRKQNKCFFSISHVANIGSHFVFFQDYGSLFICEGEEKLNGFY